MTSLRSRFQRPEIVVAPGCYDALSGMSEVILTVPLKSV